MAVTRRTWIAAAAGIAAQAQHAAQAQQPGPQPQAPQPPQPPAPPPRTRPMVCLFSKYLQKLEYPELGGVIKQMGFEGCDLTVRPGGHVEPDKVQVDMLRAIESLRGDGVEVGMLTTDITSAQPFASRAILAISGRSGVAYFKPGYWPYGPAENIEQRLGAVRQEMAQVVMLGRAYGIAAGFHNESGDHVGEATWDTWAMLSGLEPRWAGYYFDPCHATAEGGVNGWNVALRLAMPRLKMLAVKDFYWEKSGGKWKMRMCPLGQGMVDWPKVFSMLAAAKFTGPISLHCEYNPEDLLGAISADHTYLKKQVEAAYA
jgi:L-ribulose-5-phosphate 3-epimerase